MEPKLILLSTYLKKKTNTFFYFEKLTDMYIGHDLLDIPLKKTKRTANYRAISLHTHIQGIKPCLKHTTNCTLSESNTLLINMHGRLGLRASVNGSSFLRKVNKFIS